LYQGRAKPQYERGATSTAPRLRAMLAAFLTLDVILWPFEANDLNDNT
jgi:hypothetical protein